jgi:hypothetical protein
MQQGEVQFDHCFNIIVLTFALFAKMIMEQIRVEISAPARTHVVKWIENIRKQYLQKEKRYIYPCILSLLIIFSHKSIQ